MYPAMDHNSHIENIEQTNQTKDIPKHVKDLHNSLYRTTLIYGFSLVCDWIFGFGPILPDYAWKVDLLHDLVSLMIFQKVATVILPRIETAHRETTGEMLETVMLPLLTGFFSGKSVNPQVMLILMLLNLLYQYVLQGYIERFLTKIGYTYNEALEDGVQTIILLSLTDPHPGSVISKTIAVFVYHMFFKL